MEIETLFFDLGGVLIDFSLEKMCVNLAHYCGVDIQKIKKKLFDDGLSIAYERGVIDSHDIFASLCEVSAHPLDYNELLSQIAQIFTPKPEMAALIEELKAGGARLILLSNTCEAHFWHAQKYFGFLDLFDDFTLSYEVKARKPEQAIYDDALLKGQTPIEKCFYIDDISEYVEAAKTYGIDSHHFTDCATLRKALVKRGCKGLY